MPRKAPLPGDPNYRPAGGPGKGAGWGGAAKGASTVAPFTAENQPPKELNAAGHMAKAAMIARLEAVRNEVAEAYIRGLKSPVLAESMAAADKILDRLDGKPSQAVTLGKTDPFEGMTADELDAAAAHLRQHGLATGGGIGEAGDPPTE